MILPAGLIYIISICYILLQKKDVFFRLFMVCLVTEVFIRMGSFCVIGSTYLPYDMLTEMVLVLYCCTRLKNVPLKLYRVWLLLMVSCVIPILLLLLFPSSDQVATPQMTWDEIMFNGGHTIYPTVTPTVIQVTLRWTLFSIVFLYIYTNWTVSDYTKTIITFSKISKTFIAIGVVECIVKNILKREELWGNLLYTFFGDYKDTVYVARQRGGTIELNLFEQEASHYAYILTFVCIVTLSANIIQNKKKLSPAIWVAIALMLLSSSFSALYLIACFFIFYLIYRWSIEVPSSAKKEKIFLLTVVGMGFLSFASIIQIMNTEWFVLQRLLRLIENASIIFSTDAIFASSMADNSTLIRMASMIQTIMAFLKRPIFGYSLFAVHGHSTTAMHLAGVGIFGLYWWIRFYFCQLPLYKILLPVKKFYFFGLFMLLFMNLLGGDFRTHYGLMLLVFNASLCYIFTKKMTTLKYENNVDNK